MSTGQRMTEAQLQEAVMDCAALLGWQVCHFRQAWSSRGYRTPVQGDKGCPDIILARNGIVWLWECKRQGEKPTPEQQEWLAAARENGRLIYPQDWLDGTVERLLA